MHFSSIIITNTGWLLDKPRERARAKKRIRDRRDRLHLSISSRRKLSRFITFRRASRDVKSRSHQRTHINARVHTTRWWIRTKESGQTQSIDPRAHVQLLKMRADFCIYIPEIVRNVLSTYRYYICVSSGYVCIYVYIRTCIIMYNEKNYKRQYSTQ